MSERVYTKEVLALADHLFDRFPTLTGLEILAIAGETVEFYDNRDDDPTENNRRETERVLEAHRTGAARDLFAGHTSKGANQ